jgi:hypothetical protein
MTYGFGVGQPGNGDALCLFQPATGAQAVHQVHEGPADLAGGAVGAGQLVRAAHRVQAVIDAAKRDEHRSEAAQRMAFRRLCANGLRRGNRPEAGPTRPSGTGRAASGSALAPRG